MKFGLRSVFAFVLVTTVLVFVWIQYIRPADQVIEVGVCLKNWDLNKSDDELTDLINRPFPDTGQNRVGNFHRTIGNVSISPGKTAILFTTRFRPWNRDRAFQQLREVVGAFIIAEPMLEIDHFELQEFTDGTQRKRYPQKQTSTSFPLLMSANEKPGNL